ncbi:MAG TPA: hypothetical protein PK668_17370 [Myxococcota bacterium]|nr:hypothetical protein [Myxococcota bacterium]HRY94931.1 hypothetical protein [Myxococcota bacterium]
MGMRETVRSMRAYFIIAGLGVCGYAALNLIAFLEARAMPLKVWLKVFFVSMQAIGLLVGLALLYAGVMARRHLDRGEPRRVQQIVLFAGGAEVVTGLAVTGVDLWLTGGQSVVLNAIVLGVSLAITWYLYVNARRLAAEARERRAQTQPEPPPAPPV